MKLEYETEFSHYNNVVTQCKLTATVSSLGSSNIPIVIYAKTKVSGGDKFDEVTGNRIAESKALLKLYKYMRKYLSGKLEVFDSISQSLRKDVDDLNYLINKEDAHFNKLIERELTPVQ